MARPSSYKPEYAEQAAKLCRLGATDADLADFFGVTTTTIWRWRGQHEAFCNSLKAGKDESDAHVERSLFQRAIGYSFDSVKIFQYEGEPVEVPYREHVPPDTTACIFWLKNRKPAEWRDRTEVVNRTSLQSTSDEELERIIRAGGSARTSAPSPDATKPH